MLYYIYIYIKVHFTVLTHRTGRALELLRHVAQESRPFFKVYTIKFTISSDFGDILPWFCDWIVCLSESIRARELRISLFSRAGHPQRAVPAASTHGNVTAPILFDELRSISRYDISCCTTGVYIQIVRCTTFPGTMISRVSRAPRLRRQPRAASPAFVLPLCSRSASAARRVCRRQTAA